MDKRKESSYRGSDGSSAKHTPGSKAAKHPRTQIDAKKFAETLVDKYGETLALLGKE